jgi:hypothetical protein
MHVWFITGASRRSGALIVQKALAASDAIAASAHRPETVICRPGEHPNLSLRRWT